MAHLTIREADDLAETGRVFATAIVPVDGERYVVSGASPAIEESYHPLPKVRAICAIAQCRRFHEWARAQHEAGAL